MFIFTARLPKRRLIAGAAAVALLICAVFVLAGLQGRTAAADAPARPKRVKTAEDRIAYLQSYGWTVKPQPLAVEELQVPQEFGAEYADYLALQTQQGFDLTKVAGKAVKRYTYEITNYPTGETGVQVSLLIYKEKVVGADVLSPALDGFIHGLTMPAMSGVLT